MRGTTDEFARPALARVSRHRKRFRTLPMARKRDPARIVLARKKEGNLYEAFGA
jgi:hypothetical protein